MRGFVRAVTIAVTAGKLLRFTFCYFSSSIYRPGQTDQRTKKLLLYLRHTHFSNTSYRAFHFFRLTYSTKQNVSIVKILLRAHANYYI